MPSLLDWILQCTILEKQYVFLIDILDCIVPTIPVFGWNGSNLYPCISWLLPPGVRHNDGSPLHMSVPFLHFFPHLNFLVSIAKWFFFTLFFTQILWSIRSLQWPRISAARATVMPPAFYSPIPPPLSLASRVKRNEEKRREAKNTKFPRTKLS